MRTQLLAFTFFALSTCGVAACGSTPAITVVRASPGDPAQAVKGDPVKLRRGDLDAYAGLGGGYFVVRGQSDWDNVWPTGKTAPAMPTLDTATQMMLVAAAENKNTREIRITRAVETAELVYVWVRESTLGPGCKAKRLEHRPYDVVVTPRLDKPVRFFVDEQPGESCGDPPIAGVGCHVQGTDSTWRPDLQAQPGDTIECELTSSARGKFEVVDRVLSLTEQPGGSTAKLAFSQGSARASLVVDVYGTYGVQAEVTDESGRKGLARATIDARPPKTKDLLVQLLWTDFDRRDDPETFPRVTLRVAEQGSSGQRCTSEVPVPGLCEARQQGAYTHMKIPAGDRQLLLSALYIDERAEKGPAPCVHVWLDGARTAETCDRKGRAAEERWELGMLDTATGKISEAPPPPPEPPPPPPTKKPAPKKPAPKKK